MKEYISEFDQCQKYRVEKTLREGNVETTEIVYEIAADGSQSGPFIRKRFEDAELWGLYERIRKAQVDGLREPSLPRIHETGKDSRGYYSIVEFIKGVNLRSSLDADAIASFKSVCNAVDVLHEKFDPPIIHRDIKPDNVIVVPDGVVLIDFGAARTYDADKDRDTRLYATRAYAPPEQFGYAQTDRRSDIYSLGMLLAFLEMGRDPGTEVRAAINSGEGALTEIGISAPSAKTIARACAFDPSLRFATVREMLGFLEAELSRDASNCERSTQPSTDGATFLPPDSSNIVHPDSRYSTLQDEAPSVDAAARRPKPSKPVAQRLSDLKQRWDEGAFWKFGIGWDIAIGVVWAFFLAVCISVGLDPVESTFKNDTPLNLVAYIGLIMPIFTAGGAILLDWRPIHSIRPLSKIRRWHVIAVSAVVFLACLIFLKVSGAF